MTGLSATMLQQELRTYGIFFAASAPSKETEFTQLALYRH